LLPSGYGVGSGVGSGIGSGTGAGAGSVTTIPGNTVVSSTAPQFAVQPQPAHFSL